MSMSTDSRSYLLNLIYELISLFEKWWFYTKPQDLYEIFGRGIFSQFPKILEASPSPNLYILIILSEMFDDTVL